MRKKNFIIVCRGSLLSLAQAEIFRKTAYTAHPEVELTIVVRETAGDKEQSKPLHLVEGKDFFTKEIQDYLRSGEADFAIHSMKDISSDQFFNKSHYALIERDDPRDVAIFNREVINKLQSGNEIVIGTSSPRREAMATDFLTSALPKYNKKPINIRAMSIRGNVDRRLQKLTEKEYDGIILATAGLNRLLQYKPAAERVRGLLRGKIFMILPLMECPPAPGQGAIVAETTMENFEAIELLETLNVHSLKNAIKKERAFAQVYGGGCFQQFGAIHVDSPYISFTYASGKDRNGDPFTENQFDVPLEIFNKELFSSADVMKDFFDYELMNPPFFHENVEAVFVASHKAVHSSVIQNRISHLRIWAAGSRTWMELAKKGIWVEGCADGLGLDFVSTVLQSPLVNLEKEKIQILTNDESKIDWEEEGWKAIGTYKLVPSFRPEIISALRNADIIFWTSYLQFHHYKEFLKRGAVHCCLPGKTVQLFLRRGIKPIVFPGIKAFNQWRKKHILSPAGE